MNKINEEYKASTQYNLEEYNDGLAKLSRKNVALVEAMIRNDSRYSTSDKEERDCIIELKDALLRPQATSDEEYKKIVMKCVEVIDRNNSTHLNADGVGRIELAARIASYRREELLELLKHPKKDNYSLIGRIQEKTHPQDGKHKARKNYSFATKFCHYAAFWIFEGEEEQDNFSIYDSILADNLPKYAEHFGILLDRGYGENYALYISTIDSIIQKSGNEISRNGFDQILWYFHKARK